MKILGLFRHAKSDWQDARARDFDRPLNKRGRKGALVMGRHIRDYGQKWDRIVASPAARSAETIEIASKDSGHSYPINWDRRIYLASSATLLDLLREHDDADETILMVGHNPGLEDLIFDLVPDDGSSPLRDVVEAKFPTAAFAVLQIPVDRWQDVTEGSASLVHLTRPRDLDPALGPELLD
ncbi:MAG: histidine phosphatase family protein [Sphingomonadales bacterium]|nr:histidine phosphatase family protein [Sphingomonadales bacterium]